MSLTHKLLLLNENVDLAKFPTSQIPFVKYSSNQNLKYLLWALRSLIDQVTIRLKMRGILNFERINKNIEWTAYYSNKENEIALDEILGNNVFSEIAKRMYTDRATGKAWLATATDINALMVANLFLQAKK